MSLQKLLLWRLIIIKRVMNTLRIGCPVNRVPYPRSPIDSHFKNGMEMRCRSGAINQMVKVA